MLSHLSVGYGPESCLRVRPSSSSLRILPLHEEFHSPLPYPSKAVLQALPGLGPGLSRATHLAAYVPFTPSHSEEHLPLPSYRGCWHGISRGLSPRQVMIYSRHTDFTSNCPSSPTRPRWIRLSPIVQDSPLLPPVGVWAVSQSQCG